MKLPKICTIYIETTSKCNLQCTYCHRTTNEYASKNSNMPLDSFIKIISKLDTQGEVFVGNSRPVLFLHGYGEPTLNKELPDMVSEAADTGKFSEIKIVSNLLATPASRYRTLYKAGLDLVYVSLDSLDPSYVGETRVGTNVEILLENIKKVSEFAKGKLAVISVLSEKNVSHLSNIYNFLEPLHIMQWNIQLLNGFHNEFKVSRSLVDRARASLPKFPSIPINMEGFPYPKCSQPFDTLVINVRGSVSACCTFFTDDIISFGNIHDKSIDQIFLSKEFDAFRHEFSERRPPLCKECPYY